MAVPHAPADTLSHEAASATLPSSSPSSSSSSSGGGGGGSSSTVTTKLYPASSADALLVWLELSAGNSTICTGVHTEATTSSRPPTDTPAAAAAAAAVDGGAKEPSSALFAENPIKPESEPSSLPVEAEGSQHGGQVCFSTGLGMGLSYLDSPVQAPTTGQATVEVTTAHSATGARLSFTVTPRLDGSIPSAAAAPSQTSSTTARLMSESVAAACHTSGSTMVGSSTGSKSAARAGEGSSTGSAAAKMVLQPSAAADVTWSPHGMPRDAWLPRWHFDMLADTTRNNAYEAALRCDGYRAASGLQNLAAAVCGTGYIT